MTISGAKPGLNGARPTRKGSDTRERIVAAAVELFAERGYHATTMSQIGERADIQRGALYYHIKAKEELLFEVLRQHVEFVREGAEGIAADTVDARTKLRNLIIFQTQALLDRRDELIIYSRDSNALTAERLIQFRKIQDDVEHIWASVLAQGRNDHSFRDIDPAVLKGVLGLVASPYTWFRPGLRLDSAQVAVLFADLVLNGIAMPANAQMVSSSDDATSKHTRGASDRIRGPAGKFNRADG